MSATVGSPTVIGWKRRSSAGSFSTCFLYSSSVVAPTARSSPRASIGLSRLAASTAPSAAPAPTIVCSSSMKRMTWPAASWISLRTAFRRSSNSPRYFEPASSAPMSSATTRRSRSESGTSPSTMRWARPSTIAVLPTPGSPISTGLFLVRRERTWITRRISSSRPITGSSLPSRAATVRSRPNLSSAWYFSSGLGSVTRCGPRTASTASKSGVRAAPASRSASPAGVRARGEREQQVLGRDVVVVHAPGLALGVAQDVEQLAGGRGLAGAGRDGGAAVERTAEVAPDGGQIGADALEHRGDDALGLVEQRPQQVLGRCLRVAAVGREAKRRLDGLTGLLRESVELHEGVQISVGLTKILAATGSIGKRSARVP